MIDIDNYDPDSKKATSRRAARLAANELHDRTGLIRLTERLATAFTEVSLSALHPAALAKRAKADCDPPAGELHKVARNVVFRSQPVARLAPKLAQRHAGIGHHDALRIAQAVLIA